MLPHTHKALILTKIGSPLQLSHTHPTPVLVPGSAVIKILCAGLLSYSRDIYNGSRKYTLPTPSIPGSGAIGRVVAVGNDATTLRAGDLVLCDIYLRGRDDRDVGALMGVHDGHSVAARRMVHGEWRDSTYAEYVKLPLENCFRLDEEKLLGPPSSGGYSVEELLHITSFAVPYGGLRDVGLDVCETVLIAPATGMFGSAAVKVALAMGANVIAMGRNSEALEQLKSDHHNNSAGSGNGGGRLETVLITNNIQTETAAIASFGLPIDVYFDISPPSASESTHLRSGILSVRHGGRVSLMGGIKGDVSVPLGYVMHANMTIKGKWMYEREDIMRLIRMVEMGRLRVDGGSVKKYALEQWEEAFEVAAREAGPGKMVALVPSSS
jgi:threonine dehydrogenase-like Zn-dependent dehydrogenase